MEEKLIYKGNKEARIAALFVKYGIILVIIFSVIDLYQFMNAYYHSDTELRWLMYSYNEYINLDLGVENDAEPIFFLLGIPLSYVIWKIYVPALNKTRDIYLRGEEIVLKTSLKKRMKVTRSEKIFNVNDIIGYKMGRASEVGAILKQDPTNDIVYGSKNAATTWVGMIEFKDEQYLVIAGGTKRKVNKKMKLIEDKINEKEKKIIGSEKI